jgi:hypothetical protein
LIIGLLAEKEGITVSNEEVEDFRKEYDYPDDEVGLVEAGYYCLEKKVLKRFGME